MTISNLTADAYKNRKIGGYGSVRQDDDLCNSDDVEKRHHSEWLERLRPPNMGRQWSSLNISTFTMLSQHFLEKVDNPSIGTDHSDHIVSPVVSGITTPLEENEFEAQIKLAQAWDALKRALVYFRGKRVGTIAALDNSDEKLNYDQVFVRDFVPSGLTFLMNDVVKNFILKTLRLQSGEKKIDRFKLGERVMPASFKVIHDPVRNYETLIPDFGESAIGRVAPVDSGFWWIIILRVYTKSTQDTSLAELPECQKGIRLILSYQKDLTRFQHSSARMDAA